jgi:hypothetical protein
LKTNSKKIKISHLFYVSYFNFLYNYFLKFIIYKINYEIVNSEMMVLTEREKIDMTDADVPVSWML